MLSITSEGIDPNLTRIDREILEKLSPRISFDLSRDSCRRVQQVLKENVDAGLERLEKLRIEEGIEEYSEPNIF
ncbi:hypothetical protein AGABI1DRAFT_85421 [Agaricus bisporus var. burnettii JB137-S8]|uniref:Uncharacterized protein n=1 Tax=Agaricus bisporus var. burnettii (strain JB137-S8 / ATCC MYA-4627 / FGSC 10392) TaxID=597362 RepID=K5X9E6_AGABU|nr:hypothetical protein AGABI2DRAFT_137527 [Agaricus bisporus var. bisporus H97]XP_007330233.1 uncharacterized protein AGABI1DRAFT_85421 [Agaricus bisporus var. burnettii JB137-S8]EKM79617.1 hypothetical protein AGABI1DRAFT_85421 [Agaricus bisporus var. burnettii JB137-S8]EKV46080.1 hypothetical protein AGABI2DRAFT_137527 [Agaricus bisporus var. bisporus H97]